MDLLNVLKYRLEIVDDSFTTKSLIDEVISSGPPQEPLHVTELDNVVKRHFQWLHHFPRIHPYYTVRSNNDVRILGTTALLDCGYICSSKVEVMQIMELGVGPELILLKNAVKSTELLKFARKKHLVVMFENEHELKQIHQNYPEAELLIRFNVSLDSNLQTDGLHRVSQLLNLAKDFELNVIGWCSSCDVMDKTIQRGRTISDIATALGFNFRFINLEGPFLGEDDSKLQQYSTRLNQTLDVCFPAGGNLTITAECGPFLSSAAVTAISSINGKRVFFHRQYPSEIDRVFYYLNHNIAAVAGRRPIQPIAWKSSTDCGSVCRSSLFAPSNECLLDDLSLPEMNETDFFVFENQGASFRDLSELRSLPIVLVFVRRSMWDFLTTLSVSEDPRTYIVSSQYLKRVAKIDRLKFE